MINMNNQDSSDQNTELQSVKESKTITQSRNKRNGLRQQDTEAGSLGELICRYQNGDTKAGQGMLKNFDPLLERVARFFVEKKYCREIEDAKSQAVLIFLEFISSFRDFEADDRKIAGLIKKYLHDSGIDLVRNSARHCPDCYTVDFERELEENSPFAQCFPCYEMQADRELDRKFLKKVLLESMQFLTRKEGTVVKKIIIENKPPSSVAEELHCSTRYIRKLKHSALTKMHLYLETHYPALQAL